MHIASCVFESLENISNLDSTKYVGKSIHLGLLHNAYIHYGRLGYKNENKKFKSFENSYVIISN